MVSHITSKHFYQCYITATLDLKNSCIFSSLKNGSMNWGGGGGGKKKLAFISKQKYIFLENNALELL